MDIETWRKKNRLSQAELAVELNNHARHYFVMGFRKELRQRTISSWEDKGVMPRNYWVNVIESYTKKQVLVMDFHKNRTKKFKPEPIPAHA